MVCISSRSSQCCLFCNEKLAPLVARSKCDCRWAVWIAATQPACWVRSEAGAGRRNQLGLTLAIQQSENSSKMYAFTSLMSECALCSESAKIYFLSLLSYSCVSGSCTDDRYLRFICLFTCMHIEFYLWGYQRLRLRHAVSTKWNKS